jgi:hypothetical protein
MQKNNSSISTKTLKSFGITFGLLIVIIFGFFIPFIFETKIPYWPFFVGILSVMTALVMPRNLRFIYSGWMVFGSCMAWLNSRIILGFIFYFVFLPIGVIMKICKKDPLAITINKNINSYRVTSVSSNINKLQRPF